MFQKNFLMYSLSCKWMEQVGIVHRSEEHTSELQSRLHLVCRLLLEKKKQGGSDRACPNMCHFEIIVIVVGLSLYNIACCGSIYIACAIGLEFCGACVEQRVAVHDN